MWWNSMSVFQQTLFVIACATSFVLVMQIVLMLIGNSSDADVDIQGGISDADISGGADFDGADGIGSSDGAFDIPSSADGSVSDADGIGDRGTASLFGLRLLSLRSIIAFLSVGCWVGYTLCYLMDWYFALILAIVSGTAAACGMAAALIGMEKLQSNGNLNPQNAVGKIGTVYLTVPPARSGHGKINVLIQERFAEYEAVTDSNEPIPTSSDIKIVGHVGANILLVEKYKKPSIVIENEK